LRVRRGRARSDVRRLMDAKRRRLQALQTAATLHPLALACVQLADTILTEIVAEIADKSFREGVSLVASTDVVQPLLEGTSETLANGGASLSKPLLALLTEEATEMEALRAQSTEALMPATVAGSGADVFGNRPPKNSAETIVCSNCGMSLSANRFAPHLERCMLGKGRASARMARDAMRANPEG